MKYLIIIAIVICNLSFSRDIILKNPHEVIYKRIIFLNGDDWRIATDSSNVGRQNGWFEAPPVSASRQTPVPWVIQDIFHDYHGVVWYWREFDTPGDLPVNGRYLLRFHAVDYLADVWVNGKYVGVHEGGEAPFDIDITDVINSNQTNLLVLC